MVNPPNGRARRTGLEPTMVCVKNMILGMNCLFMITGLLLIGTGTAIKGYYSNFDVLLGDDLVSPAAFLIATGAIVFFVSLFGCLGAMKESTCLLNMYTICLVVIFIFELSAGLAGFVMQTAVRGTLATNFKYAIQHEYLLDDGVKNAIDNIQQCLGCCGSETPEDWEGVLNITVTQVNEVIVPDSCCGQQVLNGTDFSCEEPYNVGCLDILSEGAEAAAMLLTGTAIIVAVIQAMGIFFSNELAKAIRRVKSLRALRQMEIRSQLVNNYQAMNKEQPSTPAPVVYLADIEGEIEA